MTLTLRFFDPRMANRFMDLCERQEIEYGKSREGDKIKVIATFRTDTEKRKLIAKWAAESVEDMT